MLKLSIIIVSYNTKDFLVKCIESVVKHAKDLSYEIIVVDNNSSDGTIETIDNLQLTVNKLKVIKNKENLGFSKANNIGVKEAKGKHVLFLNSDTKVSESSLSKMVEFMEKHEEVGAATCKLLLPNGEMDDAAHRGFPTPWNSFCHFSGISKIFPRSKLIAGYSLGHLDTNTTHEIDACAGAFMMVRRKAGDEVGWWDEDYFFYGEDLDFCYRLKQKGWKIMFVSDITTLHYKGVSSGIKDVSKGITRASDETRKRITKARFDAMKIFYRKHYVDKYPKFVTFLVNIAVTYKMKYNLWRNKYEV